MKPPELPAMIRLVALGIALVALAAIVAAAPLIAAERRIRDAPSCAPTKAQQHDAWR